MGKLIVAKGIIKLPKVQKIAQSDHTGWPNHRQRHSEKTMSYEFRESLLLAGQVKIFYKNVEQNFAQNIFKCIQVREREKGDGCLER